MRTTPDPTFEMLRRLRLVDGVSDRRLRRVAGLFDPQTFKAGKIVMMERYHGEEFVLIVEGSADVAREGQHVATLGPGSFFGEAGLLTHRDRNATVRAVTPLKVLMLDADAFAVLRRELPEVAERIDEESRRRPPAPTGAG